MNLSQAISVSSQGDNYTGRIQPGWSIMDAANGGYLMAITANAMSQACGRDPVSLTAHFLSPGREGVVEVEPTLIKAGSRFSTLRASLTGGGKTVLEMLGSFGERELMEGPERISSDAPDLPPPDACERLPVFPRGDMSVLKDVIDARLHPEDAGYLRREPSNNTRLRGWIRFPGAELNSFALLIAADVFPPAIFNADLPINWTPTLELTAHMRASAQQGWLRCQFTTRFISGGLLEEDGEVWDETGQLVAQTRQLALVPRPRK